jgi:choline/glycine/proline betaine transport protein
MTGAAASPSLLTYPRGPERAQIPAHEVAPALREFAAELKTTPSRRRCRSASRTRAAVRLEVLSDGEIDFVYEVRCRPTPCPTRADRQALGRHGRGRALLPRRRASGQGGQDYCVMGWTRQQITHDVLNHYENHLQFVHSMR